jgi:hypothetical protein
VRELLVTFAQALVLSALIIGIGFVLVALFL